MTVEFAVELYRETIRTAALVGAPILGAAMLVGLTVSLIQTITSLQDQTMTFVPGLFSLSTLDTPFSVPPVPKPVTQ